MTGDNVVVIRWQLEDAINAYDGIANADLSTFFLKCLWLKQG